MTLSSTRDKNGQNEDNLCRFKAYPQSRCYHIPQDMNKNENCCISNQKNQQKNIKRSEEKRNVDEEKVNCHLTLNSNRSDIDWHIPDKKTHNMPKEEEYYQRSKANFQYSEDQIIRAIMMRVNWTLDSMEDLILFKCKLCHEFGQVSHFSNSSQIFWHLYYDHYNDRRHPSLRTNNSYSTHWIDKQAKNGNCSSSTISSLSKSQDRSLCNAYHDHYIQQQQQQKQQQRFASTRIPKMTYYDDSRFNLYPNSNLSHVVSHLANVNDPMKYQLSNFHRLKANSCHKMQYCDEEALFHGPNTEYYPSTKDLMNNYERIDLTYHRNPSIHRFDNDSMELNRNSQTPSMVVFCSESNDNHQKFKKNPNKDPNFRNIASRPIMEMSQTPISIKDFKKYPIKSNSPTTVETNRYKKSNLRRDCTWRSNSAINLIMTKEMSQNKLFKSNIISDLSNCSDKKPKQTMEDDFENENDNKKHEKLTNTSDDDFAITTNAEDQQNINETIQNNLLKDCKTGIESIKMISNSNINNTMCPNVALLSRIIPFFVKSLNKDINDLSPSKNNKKCRTQLESTNGDDFERNDVKETNSEINNIDNSNSSISRSKLLRSIAFILGTKKIQHSNHIIKDDHHDSNRNLQKSTKYIQSQVKDFESLKTKMNFINSFSNDSKHFNFNINNVNDERNDDEFTVFKDEKWILRSKRSLIKAILSLGSECNKTMKLLYPNVQIKRRGRMKKYFYHNVRFDSEFLYGQLLQLFDDGNNHITNNNNDNDSQKSHIVDLQLNSIMSWIDCHEFLDSHQNNMDRDFSGHKNYYDDYDDNEDNDDNDDYDDDYENEDKNKNNNNNNNNTIDNNYSDYDKVDE